MMDGMFIYTEAWKLKDGIKCPLTNEMGTLKMKHKNVQQTETKTLKIQKFRLIILWNKNTKPAEQNIWLCCETRTLQMKDKTLDYTVKQERFKWRTKHQSILWNKNTIIIIIKRISRVFLQMKDKISDHTAKQEHYKWSARHLIILRHRLTDAHWESHTTTAQWVCSRVENSAT